MTIVRTLLRPETPLPSALRDGWLALRADNPALSSPYFHPAYAEAVAAVSPDPVTILSAGGDTPSAILTLQGRRSTRPAGAPMSDYHGLIGDYKGGVSGFMETANIPVLHCGGLIGSTDELNSVPVCRIDLRDGVEAWRDSRNSSYSRHAKSHRRRTRKAESEIGAPRTVWQSRDVDDFNRLVALKRRQYAESGKYDVLSGWPGQLIRNLWEQGADGVRAELHTLYFGDRFAAADLGLTDGVTFHSWIVAYDPELAHYGPGIQLLEALIQAAPELNYQVIDLGEGLDGYKRHYPNVDDSVGIGVIRTIGPRASASRLYGRMEDRVETFAKLRRRYTQIAACEPRVMGRAKAMGQALTGSSGLGRTQS
jgi:CelD/BcsL family acetyltransferase involved in cellulose biosynthesis